MLAYTYISHGKFELIDKPKPCPYIVGLEIGINEGCV